MSQDTERYASYSIRVEGLVQGVGFRPFVHQKATQLGIKGHVSNGSQGVQITFNATVETAARFHTALVTQAPPLAQITNATLEEATTQFFDTFQVIASSDTGPVSLPLIPDFALCSQCRAELYQPLNRRYRYPFITCTHCGPRYSIIDSLPYDRSQTSMQEFVMCATCEAEYRNPSDRRFHSQTNSCPDCGPQLGWYETQTGTSTQPQAADLEWILQQVTTALEKGSIVAVKGIGGYLLLCDATNETAVQTLRIRKHRPTKPLAILCPTLASAQREAYVSTQEAEALQSPGAPIVLLRSKHTGTLTQGIAPALNHVGIMLPYTPLLDLIAGDFGKPVVATSGNRSGSPIIHEDDKALTGLALIADYILTNNRRIVVPQDDSVIRFTEKYHRKIVIRRSRGCSLTLGATLPYRPSNQPDSSACRLALGASLKSTFALQTPTNVHVSPYLGDLESYETQTNFRDVCQHFQKLFGALPIQSLVCDAHQGYFSTQLAHEWGKQGGIPVHQAYHHEAHLAAVLGENEPINSHQSLLGVIWDGTGYGSDGNVWGGEFLTPTTRIHFEYFDWILGDKMSREPRISALCLTYHLAEFQAVTQPQFTKQEWQVYEKLVKANTLKTSSVGRIFDGVAALLGLSEKQSYEGEAAMQLEALAQAYVAQYGYDSLQSYLTDDWNSASIPTELLITGILSDLNQKKPKEYIAAAFHFSLVHSVKLVAKRLPITQIAFSGGVFQNAVLIDLFIHQLASDFNLLFHKELSPNDENSSYGQLQYASTFSSL